MTCQQRSSNTAFCYTHWVKSTSKFFLSSNQKFGPGRHGSPQTKQDSVCVCVCVCTHVYFLPFLEDHIGGCGLVAKSCPTLAIPWTVACQAPLSMVFSRWEYWNGLSFPSPEVLPDPGIVGRFLTNWNMREAPRGSWMLVFSTCNSYKLSGGLNWSVYFWVKVTLKQ